MYGKVFASIFEGSLYGHFEATVTMMALITLANRHGEVDMTVEALAARTGFGADLLRKGIHELQQPDPRSRTPGDDGRRIVPIADHRDWGWRLVNYVQYRNTPDEETRRTQNAERQRRFREKHSLTDSASNGVTPNNDQSREVTQRNGTSRDVTRITARNAPSPQADAEAEVLERGSTNAKSRGSRFALTELPEDWLKECKRLRPDLDPKLTFECFRDYWLGKAGREGIKADWLATWRNWCRNEKAPPAKPTSVEPRLVQGRDYV